MSSCKSISYDDLFRAITNKLGVTEEVADDITTRVLNYFGYHCEIIDNALNQEDRRLFYFLQDPHLLNTNWEEELLPTGRMWRVFYWKINYNEIKRSAQPIIIGEEQPDLYESLPEDVWTREGAGV